MVKLPKNVKKLSNDKNKIMKQKRIKIGPKA